MPPPLPPSLFAEADLARFAGADAGEVLAAILRGGLRARGQPCNERAPDDAARKATILVHDGNGCVAVVQKGRQNLPERRPPSYHGNGLVHGGPELPIVALREPGDLFGLGEPDHAPLPIKDEDV